jgi:hypothetical protein
MKIFQDTLWGIFLKKDNYNMTYTAIRQTSGESATLILSTMKEWNQLSSDEKLVGSMVFNATFSNIPVISWRSVLLVEDP